MTNPQKPPLPTTNHDNRTSQYNTRTSSTLIPSHEHTHTLPHSTLSWADIAKQKRPNPQHLAFAIGRGPTSKKRHRRRTAQRQLLTSTNTAFPLSPSSPPLHTGTFKTQNDKIRTRTNTTLRRIHKKHRNILLCEATTSNEYNLDHQSNIGSRIEQTLIDIHNISETFDNTAKRIELSLEQEDYDINNIIDQYRNLTTETYSTQKQHYNAPSSNSQTTPIHYSTNTIQ